MVEHEWVIPGVGYGPSPLLNPKCLGLSEAVMLHLEFSNADEGVFATKSGLFLFFGGGLVAEFFLNSMPSKKFLKGSFFSEGELYIMHIYVNSYFYMRVILPSDW